MFTLQPPLDGRGGGLPVAAATSNGVSSGGYGGHQQQQQQPGYAPSYSQPPAQVSFAILFLHLIHFQAVKCCDAAA
jgi:hypothetical protein